MTIDLEKPYARKEHLITTLTAAVAEAREAVRVEAARIIEDPSRVAWSTDMFTASGKWHAYQCTLELIERRSLNETWTYEALTQYWQQEVIRASTSAMCRSTSVVSNLYDDSKLQAFAQLIDRNWGSRWFMACSSRPSVTRTPNLSLIVTDGRASQ